MTTPLESYDCEGPQSAENGASTPRAVRPPPFDRLRMLTAFDEAASSTVAQMPPDDRRALEAAVFGGESIEDPEEVDGGASRHRIDLQTFRALVCSGSPQTYSDCLYGRKGSDGTILRWFALWQAYRWTDADGRERSLPQLPVASILASGGVLVTRRAA